MRKFVHIDAHTLDDASAFLARYRGRARVIAGGTDLLGVMKDEILPLYPEAIIDLKTIPGLDFMQEEGGVLKIGALARLHDIAIHPVIREKYTALAEAAARTASPHLREMGTIGGNLCQDVRCWFYRTPDNRFPCLRKGGGRCYALDGDHRFHSIFGGSVEHGCYAVHPSDTAPALIALEAEAITTRRTIRVEDFFHVGIGRTTVLEPDEIVTAIRIPAPPTGTKSAFLKMAIRKSIDFPIVNCAARIARKAGRCIAARICLNAVYVKPFRATRAEEAIEGKELNEANVEMAAAAVVSEAKPLRDNAYMVQIAKTLVKRSILSCRESFGEAEG